MLPACRRTPSWGVDSGDAHCRRSLRFHTLFLSLAAHRCCSTPVSACFKHCTHHCHLPPFARTTCRNTACHHHRHRAACRLPIALPYRLPANTYRLQRCLPTCWTTTTTCALQHALPHLTPPPYHPPAALTRALFTRCYSVHWVCCWRPFIAFKHGLTWWLAFTHYRA